MDGEGIIAAVAGVLAGGGGLRLLNALRRFRGPERDAEIVAYYQGVITSLITENTELHERLGKLEQRIRSLELAQDDPPPHLG